MAKIAVVEDELHVRKLLEAALRAKGHDVTAFISGADAVLPIQDATFDLVLSDVQMPRLDGISLCRAVRQRYSKAELPIVLVSVLSNEDDILRAYDAGASDYLTKPFSTRALQARVQMLLDPSFRPSPDAPRATLRMDPTEFPTAFDKYDLSREVGAGAFGTVYEATRRCDDRPVAVKLIAPHVNDDREALARLLREIATLSRLKTPGVVGFLDAGFELGRYFVVMDLLPGDDLESLLEDGPIPLLAVATIGRDLATAIAAMQEQDLVHRDIKPANIIYDGVRATLIDLGLAKRWTEQGITQSGYLMGTADFLAPEIIHGRSTGTTSTDLYALGVTLYEALTGRRAYGQNARTPFAILEQILTGPEPPSPSSFRPDLPEPLTELVTELMEREPRQRLRDPTLVASRFEAIRAELDR